MRIACLLIVAVAVALAVPVAYHLADRLHTRRLLRRRGLID